MAIVAFLQRRGARAHVPMCAAQYKPSFRQTLVRLQRWPAATWSAPAEHWSLREWHAAAVWRADSYRRHQHGKLGLASRSAKTGRQHRGTMVRQAWVGGWVRWQDPKMKMEGAGLGVLGETEVGFL